MRKSQQILTNFWITLTILTVFTSGQFPDTLWTCPQWSCGAAGTFTLPTPVPKKPHIRWNWTDPAIVYGQPNYQALGCTTSVSTVACPTPDGYVSINPFSGQEIWTSKTNSSPYLPIVDMYGNVIKSDRSRYDFVINNGTALGSDNITQYQPEYGAAMTIGQTVVFTSSSKEGPQIATYGWFGSKFATTTLKDTMNEVNGTFIACGHPLLKFNRAYIVTHFIPENISAPNAPEVYGLKRLYAIDMTGNITENYIAWHIDLPKLKVRQSESMSDDYHKAYLAFFNDTIYINYMSSRDAFYEDSHKQPVPCPPFLCAVKDLGNSSKLLWNTTSNYGPMSMFDITDALINVTITGLRPLWLSTNWYFAAYHPLTGDGAANIILREVDGCQSLGDITSHVSVTRQAKHPDRDVLVFGTQDNQGQAHLVALEAGVFPPTKPRLLWSMNVSGPKRAPGRISQWTIGGQISSIVFTKGENGDKVKFGLVVNVVESMLWLNASQVYVRMIT